MKCKFLASAALAYTMLVAPIAPVSAQIPADESQRDPALAGDYYLRGEMETGSGLRLNSDGSFEWFLVVGSLDVFASGKWTTTPEGVVLINDPVKYASQPYRLVRSSLWADASEEEKRIGQGVAMPSCYSGDETPPENPVAKPLDDAIIIRIAFDPATLPPRDGKAQTDAYPLPDCSMIWMGNSDKGAPQYSYPDGYFQMTPKQRESATSITVHNIQYAGANTENLEVKLPQLKPGVHHIWLDYRLFEPRMFDRLLLIREEKGLRPHSGEGRSNGIYVKSVLRDDKKANEAASDHTE